MTIGWAQSGVILEAELSFQEKTWPIPGFAAKAATKIDFRGGDKQKEEEGRIKIRQN